MTTTTKPHHIPASAPEGTRVLPIIWPSGSQGGTVTWTTDDAKQNGMIEILWDDIGPSLEVAGDVVLDTTHNRAWLQNHAGEAWAAVGAPPAPLDTLVAVAELQEGDWVDLEGDRYADPERKHSELEFEFAIVGGGEQETEGCYRIDFDGFDSVGFPPDHHVIYHPEGA